MTRVLPPPMGAPVNVQARPAKPVRSGASAYEHERDMAAAKKIFASMDRKLHGQTFPSQTESFDPFDW